MRPLLKLELVLTVILLVAVVNPPVTGDISAGKVQTYEVASEIAPTVYTKPDLFLQTFTGPEIVPAAAGKGLTVTIISIWQMALSAEVTV